MRPSRARLALSRTAALFVSVGLGGFALAAGVTWHRIEDAEARLAARFEALRASRALEEPDLHESATLVSAREDLARVLEGVKRDDGLSPAFGAPGVRSQADSPEEIERLARGLRERAEWLAALEALPDELWSAEREAPAYYGVERPEGWTRRPSDGLSELRAVTNLIATQAFVVGQDPDGAADAGRWLARGLALLRATDSGSTIDMMIRTPMEQNLLTCAEALCALDGQDSEAIRAPMRAEFLRHAERDRLAACVRSDLRFQELQFQENRELSPVTESGDRRHAQIECAALVDAWCDLLESDLDAELPRLAGLAEAPDLDVFRRMHYLGFQIWKLRLDRRDAFLALR